MKKLAKQLQVKYDGKCNPQSVIQGKKYRFTVLTDSLLRLEYSDDGVFEDRPTQIVTNRKFPKPEFSVRETSDTLEISTRSFHLVYNKKEFSPNNLYIDLKHNYTNYGGRWLFGATEYGNPPREHNLKGTSRTLDRIDGPTKLDFGLLDQSGRAFFDDSYSLVLDEEGWPHARKSGIQDCYYFGYGHEYYRAIHDFYLLSGKVPLLPRFALGNWWSRYWPYTEKSYLSLLEAFDQERIPFSVGVVDMDWHVVNVPEKYGRGWTGYTWNKELFPNPKGFLNKVHKKGLRVTLNLHPADGVMPYEDAYQDMCKELKHNPSYDEPITFDVTNKEFLNAYFKYLHHPHEKEGVDFWWIDWQQGTQCSIPGLDPLRALNHFHFLDLQRNKKKRGLILSRYGGLGSHRYPIGFSGDSIISWKSLDFQPYFTATASNIGYTWWSHDIGGHMQGIRDNELMVRWVQFGVFSPINRLHSSNNQFFAKEPWTYPSPYREVYDTFLRLRHRLVPYIYTMNWRVHSEGIPFIVPIYWDYPDIQHAYTHRNQYMWGSQLMVCPITQKNNPEIQRGSVSAFIPPGIWIDAFDGTVYHGGQQGRELMLTRGIEDYPVLARAGGIVPADLNYSNSVDTNPVDLCIYLFPEGTNTFNLFEDAGDGFGYENGAYSQTEISWVWSDSPKCTISPTGDLSQIPAKRTYTLCVRGVERGTKASISSGEILKTWYEKDTHSYYVEVKPLNISEPIAVVFDQMTTYVKNDLKDRVYNLLMSFQMENLKKSEVMKLFDSGLTLSEIEGALNALPLSSSVKTAILELLSC